MANDDGNRSNSESRASVYFLFALSTIGAALGNLSQTGLNAMLPGVMWEFGVEVGLGQWLTTGYMLVLGIAVPIATYLMRRLDERKYLLVGFGFFALGSLICWISFSFYVILLGRVLQAIAVGLLIPNNQAIAMTRFPRGQQATAMGVSGIALGFAPNIGPTVGGAMDFAFGWRSFFLLLFALSFMLFILAFFFVKGKGLSPAAPFEGISFILSTLGFGGVLLGLSQASSYGLTSAWVWAPIVVGVVCLVLFLRRQRSVDNPLMDLRIFESKQFVYGLMASVFLFACYMGVTLVIPLYVQDLQGGTSLDSGLVIFPATFTALFVNPLAGVMADKTSPRVTSLLFGTFLLVGSALSATVDEQTPLWLLSVYQTTRSIGISGMIGPLAAYSLAGLEGPLIADGSSASVIIRQVAATFGTAIMVFFVASLVPLAQIGVIPLAFPYQAAFFFSATMALFCFVTVALKVR